MNKQPQIMEKERLGGFYRCSFSHRYDYLGA